jgi:hypothetical protein
VGSRRKIAVAGPPPKPAAREFWEKRARIRPGIARFSLVRARLAPKAGHGLNQSLGFPGGPGS